VTETTSEADEYPQAITTSSPAVGLVATRDNGDAIARAALRALERGHQVLITYRGDPPFAMTEFAETAGVRVIEPSTPHLTEDDLCRTLATAARTLGLPGVLFHGTSEAWIDYETSEIVFEADETACVEPVVESRGNGGPPETLVAIPAYNEAGAIGTVVSAAREHTDAVLVIDDGSDDDTALEAEQAGATVIEHVTNRGYGASLQTAFHAADRRHAEHLVVLDGDGQHDPADVPDLVAPLRNGDADVTIGSRFAPGSETELPIYRRVGIGVVNLMTNLSLGVARSRSWVKDTQSGFRAYDRRAVETLAADGEIGDRMCASTDILYHAHHNDYTIAEVGTPIDYDVEEASTENPISHGVHLVMNILKTVERDRPVTLLGVPGFFAAFVGLGFGYWTISNYINTNVFPIGLAIVSMFFLLVGIFACFTSVILHSLNTQVVQR
jgi:glycosyltransferase involved in cell wall biosynthesis